MGVRKMVSLKETRKKWMLAESVYDGYLIDLRQRIATAPKLNRKEMARLIEALITYRERYLGLCGKDD